MRALRRVLFLALLGFGAAVLVRRRSAAHSDAIGGAGGEAGGAEWPPLRPALTVPPVAAPTAASLVTTDPPAGGDAPLAEVDGRSSTAPRGFRPSTGRVRQGSP